ncbi:molybdopterin-dependent oxidoreductase [Pseudomonas amygdali]
MQRRADRLAGLVEDFQGSADRLPPGQSLVKQGFPVLDLGVHPELPLGTWSLVFSTPGQPDVMYDWTSWGELPTIQATHDIHCVTAWSVFDAGFSGVSTQELAARLTIGPGVTHLLVHSADGYSANLEIEDFLAPGSLFATHLNSEPLSVPHGGPLRLVVPHLYYWKSPKWVTRVEFLTEDQPGFWEKRGYHNRGNPWRQERYGPKQKAILNAESPEAHLAPKSPGLPPLTRWERVKRWYVDHFG